MSADSGGKAMDEPVRWVSKAEAVRQLEVSLSTLDRMIRRGEVEVVREGRRAYVRMHGPGKTPPPAGTPMRSWMRRTGRSGPRTEGRGNWQAGREWPSPGWASYWSSALSWRGFC